MSTIARHIEVEGGYNIRDLGGYPTVDGRTTRWQMLVRSGSLDQITPTGQERLVQYGVKTVIDLRDEFEVRDYPDVFMQHMSVRYLHTPLSPHNYNDSLTYTRLDEVYCTMLGTLQTNIGAIFSAIAEAEPGILFHCFAGKDRTGLVSALLLGVAGVPADVIAADYAETAPHIAHLVAQWREYAIQHAQDMARFDCDVGSEATTMLNTLAVLETEYGGGVNYLRSCGINDRQLQRLRALLLDDSIE